MSWRHNKRATADEPIFLDDQLFPELVKLINKVRWPYGETPLKEQLIKRDQAIFAFIFLSGCRISEAIEVKRKQFRIYPNRIEAVNIVPKKRGLLRSHITFPKTGGFAPITAIFEKWLIEVPDEPDYYLFPQGHCRAYHFNYKKHISRRRIYPIIALSGKFPHWGRAVNETIYGRLVFKNDPWKLKQFMGLKSLDATMPYVQGNWEESEKNVYTL